MNLTLVEQITKKQLKSDIPVFKAGDTLKVYVKIKEGNKERIQVFEGVVIRTDRKNSHTSRITVRKIASGVGVEKGFMLNSPLIEKVEVVRRSKVRRNYLSFLRERSGKSARLQGQQFDRESVNELPAEEPQEEVQEEVVSEEATAKA